MGRSRQVRPQSETPGEFNEHPDNAVALRVDGLMDFNENDTRNMAVQAGMSFYRHTAPGTHTVAVLAPATGLRQCGRDATAARCRGGVQALRASLAEASVAEPESRPPSSVVALGTMNEVIHFAHDESLVDAQARSILDAKLPVFRANPAMRIVITGYTSTPGTAEYNWALGFRRAEATRAYLVSRGIDPIRIEIATGGEGNPVIDRPGDRVAAASRRAEFRILVADPHLTAGH